MSLSLEELYREAMQLTNEAKALLAEKILASLASNENQTEHLAIVKRRREELLSNKVQPIDGEAALRQVRHLISK